MIYYKDLINIDDPIVPPSDSVSESLYTNTKLNYALQNSDPQDEYDQIDETNDGTSNNDNQELVSYSTKEPTRDSNSSTTADEGDVSNLKLLRVIAGAHQGWVRSLKVDPVTNQWFATGGTDSAIKVWDLASLSCKATISGHIMAVRSLAISKKFPYLFSGSEDKTVRCFDLERSNSPLGCQIRNYHGHLGGIYAMDLHPELDILFTGGKDMSIRAWDIRSRAEIMTLTGHKSDVTSIIASESDPQVVSSSMDGNIRLWDLRKQTTYLTITQHSKSIRLLINHPKESTICSGDALGNIKQWLLPPGDLLNEFGNSGKIINTMSVNHTNNKLFAGFDNGEFEIYDYINGKTLQKGKTIPSPGSLESSIYCSAFDLLGLRLITGESDNSIKIWGEP